MRVLPGTRAEVAFSPDGRWLVTGTTAEYSFWDVASLGEVDPPSAPVRQLARDGSQPLAGRMAFSPDGEVLALARSAQQVQLVNPATGTELATLTAPESYLISWLCFSPDGTRLAVATESQVIQYWDLRLIRRQLAVMGLDWEMPPYPGATEPADRRPLGVEVLPGPKR